jgi:hypothetical protein
MSRREDILSCIDVTIMDRCANTALPSSDSKALPALRAGAGGDARAAIPRPPEGRRLSRGTQMKRTAPTTSDLAILRVLWRKGPCEAAESGSRWAA